MTCSCQETSTSNTNIDTTGCTCEVVSTIINPKTINPITSTEVASNKYSIEAEIKPRNTSGTQCTTRAGIASGATNADIIEYIQTELYDVVTEIIRTVVAEDYEGPAFSLVDGTVTVSTFQIIVQNVGGQTTFTSPTAVQTAKINYIAQVLYPIFVQINDHIESVGDSTSICVIGAPRIFQGTVSNCLFCLKLIYN